MLKAGDELLLWDASDENAGRTAVVELQRLGGERAKTLRIDRRSKGFDAATGQDHGPTEPRDKTAVEASFEGVKLPIQSEQSRLCLPQQDPRRQRGCMYNGTRGLIEGNDFENCRGPGIARVFIANQAGYGARNVVVKNNTVKNTGRLQSQAFRPPVGGNIISKIIILFTPPPGRWFALGAIHIRGVRMGW